MDCQPCLLKIKRTPETIQSIAFSAKAINAPSHLLSLTESDKFTAME
jgi:hypothetical protein